LNDILRYIKLWEELVANLSASRIPDGIFGFKAY
jgi:hypothetical protein